MIHAEDFTVTKDGKRVDNHILSIDFHTGVIIFTDKSNRVRYENQGFEGYDVVYEKQDKIK